MRKRARQGRRRRTLRTEYLIRSCDAENRLQTITTSAGETVTFTYAGDGRRALRDTATETVAYIGPHYELRFDKPPMVEDLDDDCVITVIDIMRVAVRWGQAGGPEDVNRDGTVDVGDVQRVAGLWRETCHVLAGTTKYYSLGGWRVAMRKDGTLYYLFGDHLGSTSVAYNTTNGQAQTMRYYPWGSVRNGDIPTDRRFTGQRWDGTIGLYDYNARWYEPALGRFVQPDTIVPEPGNPQDLNRYAYARNNPLIYTDPSGHCPWCIAIGVGALIGGGISYGTQVAANISQNGLNVQAFTNVSWGQVAVGAATGAVGGATFGLGMAGATVVLGAVGAGEGAIAGVATAAVVNASAGQVTRATENVLTGRPLSEGLGGPGDLAFDAAFGAVTAVPGAVLYKRISNPYQATHRGLAPEAHIEAQQEVGDALYRLHRFFGRDVEVRYDRFARGPNKQPLLNPRGNNIFADVQAFKASTNSPLSLPYEIEPWDLYEVRYALKDWTYQGANYIRYPYAR